MLQSETESSDRLRSGRTAPASREANLCETLRLPAFVAKIKIREFVVKK